MYDLATKLFPITRSITGEGVRDTLREIRHFLPEMKLYEVPTGTVAFDWVVPMEWNIRDAFVMNEAGEKIIDFRKSNLHVISYSVPVNRTISLEELETHLHSLPDQPDAIPYITSYYEPRWGFCIAQNERNKLRKGLYRVVIDSTLAEGSLTYGEVLLPGQEQREILLSTYICHPSMANNELSGPVVTTFLAKWLREQARRRYTYRIVFIPETIGSIVYLSRNLEQMKKQTVAGFVVTCVGDDRTYSFIPSRLGNTLADKVAEHVLRHYTPSFDRYSFLSRGSDERQYCGPGVDLPVVSVMRSKYGEYPEYHTSLDDLSLISPKGLGGAYEILKKCLTALNRNHRYRVTVTCEPQMGRRDLYPTLSSKGSSLRVRDMMNLLAYSDGERDLIDIAEAIEIPIDRCYPVVDTLVKHGLLEVVDPY